MPTYPDEILTAAAEAMQQREHMFGEDPWTANAKVALDAAAPLLAEAVAQAILRHADEHEPKPGSSFYLAWHRHFGTAARIAAGAFTTEAESKQQAAEALVSGAFVACVIPESGGQDDA